MRTLTPQDAHVLINEIANEMLGKNATVTAVDTASFISVGETLLQSGTENVMNAIAIVLGRRMAATRPYKGKFRLTRAASSGVYSSRFSRIKFYAKPALGDGSTNNQLTTNLADGFDNNVNGGVSEVNQYEQHQAIPVELFFGGSSTWQDAITRYENQIQTAFRDESSFNEFITGMLIEKNNDIEQQKEAFDRAAVLNYAAGIYDLKDSMEGSAINLTEEFNNDNGTSYTTAQLLSTYQDTFYKWFVAKIKVLSDFMTNRSYKYHLTLPKTVNDVEYKLAEFTPKAKQKMYLLNSFMAKASTMVLPGIFNTEYLSLENYEGIDYWQNINEPSKINVTPAIPNVDNPTSQTTGANVSLDLVIGLLFDEDALLTDHQLDMAATTPLEARKLYRNTWWTFRKNQINDFSYNGILLYMADATAKTTSKS